MGRVAALWAALTLLAAVVPAQTPLSEIAVSGNKRLPGAAIALATGLRVNQKATRADLDKASQTLFDTGLFTSVQYRYEPKAARGGATWAVTFDVVEDRADTPVRLDIPGFEEDKLWPDLKRADGLLDTRIPTNDHASEYYRRAIEAYLQKVGQPHKLAMNNQTDLKTRQMEAAFYPTDLPEITAIRFDGNRAVDTVRLESATAKLVVGGKYSERQLRSVVELNLRPIYEDRAYLTVAFPSVKVNGPAVEVQVVEGPLWSLGKVALLGDDLPEDEMLKMGAFPEGKAANWNLIVDAISRMEKVLRADGYLAVASKPVRQFHEADRAVDLRIDVRKGQQFVFGALEIHGLPAVDEPRASKAWKLAPGAPMNEYYFVEYSKSVMPQLRGVAKSVEAKMRPRPNSNIMDMVLMFK